MTDCPTDRLTELLRGREWVKGAVNFDEDLHFSTYYLRASCAGRTAPLYPGYSATVAFYSGCNETYYLLREECTATATAIVQKALRRPGWLPRVLAAIYRRSDLLARAFPPELSAARLRRLPDVGLLCLLRRHAVRQRALNHVARLPESLDRGTAYFTGYLTDHLSGLGVPPADLCDTFAVLSQPLVPSVLAQEALDLDRIAQSVRAVPGAAERLLGHGARAHLFLSPDLRRRLDAHREKWQFLPYHGYGRRELATPRSCLDRLLEHLRQPAGAPSALVQRRDEGRAARQRLLGRLRLDEAHRRLFDVYPEIGAAKLYRRHAQLRNFYYLDLLLAEVAHRLDVPEAFVRCMLPEEIDACLEARRPVPAGVAERVGACLYALIDGQEQVVGGDVARDLARLFQEATRGPVGEKVLTGTVASQGKVTGPCKVVIRADDVRGGLPKGAILVSEATDPDLLGLLRQACGVLTEQGGVTSHAAIICRELGLPTIIGIAGLLDRVHDGDHVEVDAFRGTVTLLDGPETSAVTVAQAPDVVGAKAYNLGVVRALGFLVPDFVVLAGDTLQRLLDGPDTADGLRQVERAVARLGLAPGETVAVRSSALGEDGDHGSLAGSFRSRLHVRREDVADALRELARVNGGGDSGAIIVQRMIAAEYGGVCLTLDRRTGRGNAVILEMVAGDNVGVTAGSVVPDRVVVDRLTGDVLEAERHCARLREAAIDVAGLVRQFLTLESRFGKPLDVEWAWAEGRLYILQARPIVNGRH
jgi:phosphohistidine swiveling domain-containing protein